MKIEKTCRDEGKGVLAAVGPARTILHHREVPTAPGDTRSCRLPLGLGNLLGAHGRRREAVGVQTCLLLLSVSCGLR